jgi:SprT protein
VLQFIPDNSHPYINSLLDRYNFRLIINRERVTKLGDFRRDRNNNFTITINRNLNQYQFLITFIHELAHLKVAEEFPRSRKAHGQEWKEAFRTLMLPLLNTSVFPDLLLRVLAKHMRNPKAAAASDPKLWNALKAYDASAIGNSILDEVTNGNKFRFRKKIYQKIEKRRTRVLCKEIVSGKLYLIPAIADIEML